MRKTGIGVLLALALVFGSMFAASELGGEVVTLTTRDPDGTSYQTSLWIVEDDGALWLRASNQGSAWLLRLHTTPQVDIERGGQTVRYRAEPVADRRERINELMAREYGWADGLIGTMRDTENTVAIRLVPLGS